MEVTEPSIKHLLAQRLIDQEAVRIHARRNALDMLEETARAEHAGEQWLTEAYPVSGDALAAERFAFGGGR